jgi:hypothetical protein
MFLEAFEIAKWFDLVARNNTQRVSQEVGETGECVAKSMVPVNIRTVHIR